jgi:hypothetical protein
MSSRNTKTKQANIMSSTDNESTDDIKTPIKKPVKKTPAPKKTQPVVEEKPIVETDTDSSDDDTPSPKQQFKKAPESKKAQVEPTDDESNQDTDSNSEDEEQVKKPEKKAKLSTAEIASEKSQIYKRLTEVYKMKEDNLLVQTKLYKEEKTLVRQLEKLDKLHDKSNSEDLIKCKKEKPKRQGNGGFKKEAVPTTLANYLDISDDVVRSRPEIYKILNDKFKALGLKKGREAFLDETACKALKQSVTSRTLGFTDFMPFINEFYPPKADKK